MATERIPCGGWYVDGTTLTFNENKILSIVGGGGAVGVASFNGRTGAVTPQVGDYTAEQVGAVSLSGGTMTGNLILNGDPTNNLQAATKQYVDVLGDTVNDILDGTEALPYLHDDYTPPIATSSSVGTVKPGTGLEVSGDGTLSVTISPTSGITQEQADLRYLQLSGGTLTGNLALGDNKIKTNSTPSEVSDVTNKDYVDGVVKVVSDEVDGIIAGTTPISVPIATDAKVGGVKVGAGLSVDGEGTLTTAQTYLSTQGGTMTGAIAMGSQKITGLADATDPGDALNKKVGDATYALKTAIPTNATTATAGIVKQAAAVADSTGATDTTLETKVNELIGALRNAGIIAPNV